MKIKKFLLVLLISVFTFGKTPQAIPIPFQNIFAQGIYDFTPLAGAYCDIKLSTPGKPVTISVINSDGVQKNFLKLTDEKVEFKIGPVQKGDTYVVVGTGEAFIVHFH